MTEIQSDKINHRDEISLKDIILTSKAWGCYIWSKKWIIVAIGTLGAVIGFFYALKSKNTYIATTTFVLENGEKAGGLGTYSGLASMVGLDVGGGGGIFQGDNILELYKSRKMIEKTLSSDIDTSTKETIGDRYLEVSGLKETLGEQLKINKFSFKAISSLKKQMRFRDSIINSIVRNINMNLLTVGKPDKKLSIIRVDVGWNDEVFAKRFNEELVKNVSDFYIQTKTQKSLDNILALQRKTDSVKTEMNGAIYRSVAVADATPNANLTRQVQRTVPIQRAQFSVETNKTILGELVKNLEMAKMALMREAPLVQVIDEPRYPLNIERLGKTKAIIVGFFLFVFVTVFLLTIKKIYKDIING